MAIYPRQTKSEKDLPLCSRHLTRPARIAIFALSILVYLYKSINIHFMFFILKIDF